jgi:hypothetical protein
MDLERYRIGMDAASFLQLRGKRELSLLHESSNSKRRSSLSYLAGTPMSKNNFASRCKCAVHLKAVECPAAVIIPSDGQPLLVPFDSQAPNATIQKVLLQIQLPLAKRKRGRTM